MKQSSQQPGESGNPRAASNLNLYTEPHEILTQLVHCVKPKSKILVVCDKDGTLDNAHQTEAVHRTPPSMVGCLKRVAATATIFDGPIELAIVSGRGLQELMVLVGDIPGAWLIGCHGVEAKTPNGLVQKIGITPIYFEKLAGLKADLKDMLDRSGLLASGVILECDQTKVNVCWVHCPSQRTRCLTYLDEAIRNSGIEPHVEILLGSMSREILPAGAGKGMALRRLVETSTPDFVLCAGNDIPDLSMFEWLRASALPHLNIIVGCDVQFDGAVHLKAPESLGVVLAGLSI